MITALGEYLSGITERASNPDIVVEGPQTTHVIQDERTYTAKQKGPDCRYRVKNTGGADAYVTLTRRGVPAKPVNEATTSGGLEIRRRMLNMSGSVTRGRFSHMSSYLVNLRMKCESEFDNVIVADQLPAGFEVENPRLSPDSMPHLGLHNTVAPSHLDIRDDRVILAFDSLDETDEHRQWENYYYVVRAVTPGRFQHPAVAAECMYDPSISATGNVTDVVIE